MLNGFHKLYFQLALLMSPYAVAEPSWAAVNPTDCSTGRSDNTCAAAVQSPPEGGSTAPPPPAPPTTFRLAGIPAFNYWYFGYDFQTPDAYQGALPQFVNRSNQTIRLMFTFTIPAGNCGDDCLPAVEFYKGSNQVVKIDPPLVIKGNEATTALDVYGGESYSWVIGLWQSRDPKISVADEYGNATSLSNAGLSSRPDIANLILGIPTTCLCSDGSEALCNRGDRYSNGLLGEWSKNIGVLRTNSWSNCQHEGS